jgi:hypothetical protein
MVFQAMMTRWIFLGNKKRWIYQRSILIPVWLAKKASTPGWLILRIASHARLVGIPASYCPHSASDAKQGGSKSMVP